MHTRHVEASLIIWLGEFQRKYFVLKLLKFVKNLQNLFVGEMISNWGHPALLHYLDNGDNMTISSSVMIPVIFTILPCIRQRLVICYVIIFVFFWVVALIWRSTIWQLEMISYFLGSYQLMISGDLSRGADDARNLRLLFYHNGLHFVQSSANFIILEGEAVSFISLKVC